MNSIETIFNSSGLLHDRFFNESFNLPYSFEEIQIQSNELVSHLSINQSLEKLNHNFMYLYSLTKLGSNIIPDGLSFYAGVSSTNTFTAFPTGADQTGFVPFSAAGLSYFDTATINKVVFSDLRNAPLMVTCSMSAVILTQVPTTTATTFTVILSTGVTNTNSSLAFGNITSALIHNQSLYVVDTAYNNVYKYDLSGFLSDSAVPPTLTIDQVIGGAGNFQDKYKFNGVNSICALDNRLYVNDAGNYSVKIYDLDFNFIDVVHLKTTFANDKATHISVDPFSKRLIFVTAGNRLITFSSDFKTKQESDLNRFFNPGEVVNSIFVLKSFKNFVFVATNQTVYKFYISKPKNLVGKYTLYRFNTDTNSVIISADSVINLTETGDDVYILAKQNNAARFIKVLESDNYADVLKLSDFEVFTLDEIKVQHDEYLQTWVISKAIQKLLLNHIRLKDQIIGRFFGQYDSRNNLILGGYTYFLMADLDLTAYEVTLDHFVGNNEALTNSVINRGLRKIFDLQSSILAKSNTPIHTSTPFETSPVLIS